MRELPNPAWTAIESFASWGSLGLFVALSTYRRNQAILEAIRRVLGGGLWPRSSVVIHSLKKHTALNGVRGVCVAFERSTARWHVKMSCGAVKDFASENLQAIGRISRPMALIGSTRGARQISVALPALLLTHVLDGRQGLLVKELFNQQIRRLVAQKQGGIVFALACLAGMSGPTIDATPRRIREISSRELSCTLADACQQPSVPCRAHLAALLNARADVHGTDIKSKVPLEYLARSSADLVSLLGPVKLLAERGAVARTSYVKGALVRIGVDLHAALEFLRQPSVDPCVQDVDFAAAVEVEWRLVWSRVWICDCGVRMASCVIRQRCIGTDG